MARLGLDQGPPWPWHEPCRQDLRGQLAPSFAEPQRGERFKDRLAAVGGLERDRVQQQREVAADPRVVAGDQLPRTAIRRAGLDAIDQLGAKRVLIDSLTDVLFASGEEIRFREYMYSLIQRCSGQASVCS